MFFLISNVVFGLSGMFFEKCIYEVSQKGEIRLFAPSIYIPAAAVDGE
jgi:hypothetical protein